MTLWESMTGKLLLTITLLPVVSFAQDGAYRAAVFCGAGYGTFFDDEGSLGSGPTYRAGAEWRVSRRLGLRGELLGIHHSRNDAFEVRGNAEHVLGNAVFYFSSRSNIQPYLTAGLGLQRVAHTYSWPGLPFGPYRTRRNDFAADFGIGMKVFVNRRWSLDPEFTTSVGRNYFALANYFSMKAAYHW